MSDDTLLTHSVTDLTNDDESRRQATVAWGRERSDTGLEKLLEALGDDSWRVRKAALDGLLGYHPHPRLIPALVQALCAADNAGMRNASAEALIKLGESAVGDLTQALTHSDPELRKFAVDILGDIGAASAVPQLIGSLDDADENVRAAAAESIGKIGGEAGMQALWDKALRSADLLLKLSALESLAKLEAPGEFERLQELYKNRFLAKPTLALLGVCPDPRAPVMLATAIGESTKSLRGAALIAFLRRLRGMRPDELATVTETLRQRRATLLTSVSEFLHAADTDLVRGAMKVLGLLGEPQVARSILEAVRGERLLDAAEQALLDLGPQASAAIAEALPWISEEARELAASVLAVQGDPRAMRVLVGTLLRGEERTREVAARVLARIGREDIIDELIGALAEAKNGAGALVEEVLRGMIARQPEVIRKRLAIVIAGSQRNLASGLRLFAYVAEAQDAPMLTQFLKHEKPEVRAAAAAGLVRLDTPEVKHAFVLALSDEAPRVRELAAQGLARFRDDEVLQALVVASKDEDAQVASAAAHSLSRFASPVAREQLAALATGDRATVVMAAIQGLSTLDPARAFELLPELLAHPDKEVVKEVARVVLPLKPLEAQRYFSQLLGSAHWDVRFIAVQILAGVQSGLSLLEEQLAVEQDELVRQELRKVLQQRSKGK